MYEYTCPNCGKTKKVRYPWEVRTYCSAKCSAVHREEEKRRAVAAINAGECIFHPESVMCGKRDCTNCGWNPVVAKARLGEMGYDPEWKPEPEPETDKFGEWISCDERMPQDKVQVLAYTRTGKVMSLHCKEGKWCATSNVTLSHWMPMPPKPEV